MQVEVYFDVLCPWCYIGKRRLATALKGRNDVHIVGRSSNSIRTEAPSPA